MTPVTYSLVLATSWNSGYNLKLDGVTGKLGSPIHATNRSCCAPHNILRRLKGGGLLSRGLITEAKKGSLERRAS